MDKKQAKNPKKGTFERVYGCLTDFLPTGLTWRSRRNSRNGHFLTIFGHKFAILPQFSCMVPEEVSKFSSL